MNPAIHDPDDDGPVTPPTIDADSPITVTDLGHWVVKGEKPPSMLRFLWELACGEAWPLTVSALVAFALCLCWIVVRFYSP